MMQKVIRTCKSRTFGMRAIAFLLAFLMVISPLTAFAADMDPDISDLPTSGEDVGDDLGGGAGNNFGCLYGSMAGF